jgi:tetratricopeptide (TPR) repeat protein
MYLPLVGVVSFVVLAGYWAWRRLVPAPAGPGARRMHVHGIVPLAALAAIVTAGGARTYVRNMDYRTDLSIWQDTVDKWPGSPRGHQNLAWALVAAGNLDRAMAEIECSVRLNPSYLRALVTRAAIYGVRGGLYQDTGRFAEAWSDYARGLEDCTRVITLRPGEADAYNNRGEIFRRRGTLLRAQGRSIAGTRRKESAELYDRACHDFSSALNDLGVAIRFRRRDASAYGKRAAASLDLAVTCREALVLNFGTPADLRPIIDRAFTQAFYDWATAAETEDVPAQVYFDTANAHAEFGSYLRLTGEDPWDHYMRAIRDYTQAIQLAPTMAEAYENRAAAYEAAGQPVPAGLDRALAARLRSR